MNIIRGEYFPQACTKVLVHYDNLYCDPNTIEDGDIIYTDTHHALLFKDLLNERKNLTIVTSNSDHCLYDGPTNNPNGIDVQQLTCWIRWFGQNSYSENVIPIPIGFENMRWETSFGPKTQWLRDARESKVSPTKTVYLNCNKNTSLEARQQCYNSAKQMNFVTVDQPNLTYQQYLSRIKEHKFVLSPRGNGLDCHRTWEILMMRRVPIIKKEGSMERLYKNMPVLFVDEWSDLINMDLEKMYEEFFFDNQDYLTKDYWLNLIN
jgi:hypothetical protein